VCDSGDADVSPQDTNDDVRQTSYALLGDCAIYVFAQLQPHLPNVMDLLTRQLNVDQRDECDEDSWFGVINNACWSCGEITLRHGKRQLRLLSQP